MGIELVEVVVAEDEAEVAVVEEEVEGVRNNQSNQLLNPSHLQH